MSDTTYHPAERRPIATRDLEIVQRVAAWLIAQGVSANAVSVSSLAFAALASLCLIETVSTDVFGRRWLFILAALFVQLRLLANLLDGMIAVGSGQSSRQGELYNEAPDRAADVLILIGAGFATGGTPALGYLAALAAVFVAYVRALGSSLGVRSLFIGPMAKPQRMGMITAACVYCACAPGGWPGGLTAEEPGAVTVALTLIIAGAGLTAWRRLRRIAAELRETAS